MIDRVDNPGQEFYSTARKFGELLKNQLEQDPRFYLFSPDETTSNKLDQTYQATSRAWGLPQKPWDLPESQNGRIVELLSENVLFATMVGHLMNREPAMMTSYEAFFSIVLPQFSNKSNFTNKWTPSPGVNPGPPSTSSPLPCAGAKTTTASRTSLPPPFPPYSTSPAPKSTVSFP